MKKICDYKNQPKVGLKTSFSADFWSEWPDSNRRHRSPKLRALPAAPHPDWWKYSVFSVKSVSGQICGQKFFAEEHGGGKARKREKNGDFASFRRSAHEAVTRSQTSRTTNCATPRHCFIIAGLGRFVKTKNNIVGKYIPAQWYIVGAVRVASTWRRLAGKTAVWQ